MMNKTTIYFLLLVAITLIAGWAIPSFTHKATEERVQYPFACYSSILKELCFIEFQDDERPIHDKSGKMYTEEQLDSLTPLLHFRQLMMDGKMPDSINGRKIEPQAVREKTLVYRYNPADAHVPELGLYLMFESMPQSVDLELPEDVFRMDEKICFMKAESNEVDGPKSRQFQEVLEKEGFAFPPQWVSGNKSLYKSYDEGYFCLDKTGRLFHLKMVNGQPFVRDTQVGDSLQVSSFSMTETNDRRFYGYLFDERKGVYILESNQKGGYQPRKLDIAPFDPSHDELFIMGNLLYWTVTVTTPEGVFYYGLDTETLKRVDEYHLSKRPDLWEKTAGWLFPWYVVFKHPNDSYVYPSIIVTGWKAMGVNLLLALVMLLFAPALSTKRRIFRFVYLLLSGIAGAVAFLLLPGFFLHKIK